MVLGPWGESEERSVIASGSGALASSNNSSRTTAEAVTVTMVVQVGAPLELPSSSLELPSSSFEQYIQHSPRCTPRASYELPRPPRGPLELDPPELPRASFEFLRTPGTGTGTLRVPSSSLELPRRSPRAPLSSPRASSLGFLELPRAPLEPPRASLELPSTSFSGCIAGVAAAAAGDGRAEFASPSGQKEWREGG